MDPDKAKNIVKEKYSKIVKKSEETASCCCSSPQNSDGTYTVFSEDYTKKKGYNQDADLSLGCGIPTDHANIKRGNIVLDLGSGAGNDCFVARALVGETGKVIGLDFTEDMINKAYENAEKIGFQNVEFILGDIESMPLNNNTIDVIISNCVLNLVPDKLKAYSEIYRVLKNSGHFCNSDVVITGALPDQLRKSAEMYAGCVAGASQKDEYIDIIKKAGFKDIEIKKEKEIKLPEKILRNFLPAKEYDDYINSNTGIFSITVYGRK